MKVKRGTYTNLDEHWLISAMDKESLERAWLASEQGFLAARKGSSVNGHDAVDIPDAEIVRAGRIYDSVAIEALDAILEERGPEKEARAQLKESATKAFALYTYFPSEKDDHRRVFHSLRILGLACASERWEDVNRWMRKNPQEIAIPQTKSISWDRRIFFELFDCWVKLVKSDERNGIEQVVRIVDEIWRDQSVLERDYLESIEEDQKRPKEIGLLAAYNWAKATEVLAKWMLEGGSADITGKLNRLFAFSADAAETTRDIGMHFQYTWLNISSRIIVQRILSRNGSDNASGRSLLAEAL